MMKAVRMCAALGMIATLCVGCGKADKPAPAEEAPKTAAATETKEMSATQWEPETATQPGDHNPDDGRDHSGHNH